MNLFDHFMRIRIATLIMSKMFIQPPKLMGKETTTHDLDLLICAYISYERWVQNQSVCFKTHFILFNKYLLCKISRCWYWAGCWLSLSCGHAPLSKDLCSTPWELQVHVQCEVWKPFVDCVFGTSCCLPCTI